MINNVGTLDRGIRVIIGLAFLSVIFLRPDGSRWFGLIGLIPLVTAYLSWCPLYTVFGVKTCGCETK
jgi:hypothetical protein